MFEPINGAVIAGYASGRIKVHTWLYYTGKQVLGELKF